MDGTNKLSGQRNVRSTAQQTMPQFFRQVTDNAMLSKMLLNRGSVAAPNLAQAFLDRGTAQRAERDLRASSTTPCQER
jgi:hypothetical protein